MTQFTIWTYAYAGIYLLHHLWEFFLSYLDKLWLKKHADGMPDWMTGLFDEARYKSSIQYGLEWKSLNARHQLTEAVLHWAMILVLYRIFDDVACRLTSNFVFQGLMFFLLLGVVSLIVDLPFSIYSDFYIEAKYGFNKKTPQTFVIDMLKTVILSLVLGGPLLASVLFLMNYAGSSWWIWVFVLICLYQLTILWVYPAWIAPLFNKFVPVDSELADDIQKIAAKAGCRIAGIFTMDGSKRTAHSNAYFTGFGKFKRIVFYDTLIPKITKDQLLSVLAHEMGHYKLGHIKKNLMVMIPAVFVFLAFLAYTKNQAVLYPSFGFDRPSNHAALIIFSHFVSEIMFPFAYLFTFLSRKNEFASDRFSTKIIGSGEPLIEALKVLHTDNLDSAVVHPWFAAYHYSHPGLQERMEHLRQFSSSLSQ